MIVTLENGFVVEVIFKLEESEGTVFVLSSTTGLASGTGAGSVGVSSFGVGVLKYSYLIMMFP